MIFFKSRDTKKIAVDAEPQTHNEVRQAQIKDFLSVYQRLRPEIPLVCVCGNHDVGNKPDVDAVQSYRSEIKNGSFVSRETF